MDPNRRHHTLHRCDVCGKDIVGGDEAQVTADTILCVQCLRKAVRDGPIREGETRPEIEAGP